MSLDANEYLLKVATKIGELTTAVEAQGKSIDALFSQTRNIRDDISSLKDDDLLNIKIGLSNLKLKVFGIGVAGTFIANIALIIFKKWPWGK